MWKTLYQQPNSEMAINTWGVMITVAFAAAAWVVHRRVKRVGIDPDKMVWLYVIAIVGGLAGARLLHFTMATPEKFFSDPMAFFRLSEGGFALYGGIIMAGLAGITYGIVRGIDPLKMSDAVFPAVLLGIALGRVGCFFAGCCHGAAHALPDDAIALFPESFSGGQLWLVLGPPFLLELTRDGVGTNNAVVMATQLYEVTAALVMFGVSSVLWRHRHFDGEVFGVSLMMYAIWRPFNESLRGDTVRGTTYLDWLPADWPVHTTSQVVSIPVFLTGALLILLLGLFRRRVSPEVPFTPSLEETIEGSAPKL